MRRGISQRPSGGRGFAMACALGAACITLFSAGTAFAQKTLLNHTYTKAGNTRIKVESVFDAALSTGYMPVRVTIRNGTKSDRNWDLNFSMGSSYNGFTNDSSFRVSAQANSEVVHELLVPLPLSVESNNYSSFSVSVNAPGLGATSSNDSNQIYTDWPAVGISSALALRSITPLNAEVQRIASYGNEVFGGKFDPKMLPSDWRGYSGLDVLMITDKEWDTVPSAARKAILRWVRMGGLLDIHTEQNGLKPSDYGFNDSDSVNNGDHHFSLGAVKVIMWDGRELKVKPTAERYRKIRNRSKNYTEDFDSDWGLQRDFGIIKSDKGIVLLLLLAFAIIVGPVNLFVFAKPGKRQKLFITVPLISLIASALIFALIMVKDGFGGDGHRITFANLQPGADEKQLYLRQEQISRTGVLLSTGFEIAESAFATPVRMQASEMNRLIDQRNQTRGKFSKSGDAYRGDWFQSRSEQGQAILAVRPTRSRIELRAPASGDEPPKLFSSLEFTLGEFYYCDANKKIWKSKASKIAPGNEIPLEAATPADLKKWWNDQTSNFSSTFRREIRQMEGVRNHFFATSTDERAGLIDSLESIDWKDDLVVMTGAVLVEGAASSEPATEESNPPQNP